MKTNLLGILILFMLHQSIAIAGDSGHAGDPAVYRGKLALEKRVAVATQYKNSLDEYLKKTILGTLQMYELYQAEYDKIMEPQVAEMMARMIQGRVIETLKNPSFTYKVITDEYCRDSKGDPWAATAKLNDIGGEICVSALRLVEIQADPLEVVGLMLHEHAHHYGYEDKDHKMFDVALAVERKELRDWPNSCYESIPRGTYKIIPYSQIDKLGTELNISVARSPQGPTWAKVHVMSELCDLPGYVNCQLIVDSLASFPKENKAIVVNARGDLTISKESILDRVLRITFKPINQNGTIFNFKYAVWYLNPYNPQTFWDFYNDADISYWNTSVGNEVSYTFLSERSSKYCELREAVPWWLYKYLETPPLY